MLFTLPPYRANPEDQVCGVRAGQRVLLASLSSDPDVFVFDSRPRLIDYEAGHFDSVQSVIRHTMLVKPGTHAIVASCEHGVVKPSYSPESFDAVGIKLTSGPYRNRWGWVSSEDVRLALEGVLSNRSRDKTRTGEAGSQPL